MRPPEPDGQAPDASCEPVAPAGTRASAGGSPGQIVVFDGAGWVAASWEMAADLSVDLELIDGLCRLRQAARAMGWAVALHDPSVDLRDVLEFVGLSGVVPMVDSPEPVDWGGSVVEVVGQTEEAEELGPEEVVQPDDLAS